MTSTTKTEYERSWRYLRAVRRWFLIGGLVGGLVSAMLIAVSRQPGLRFLAAPPMLWMVAMLFLVTQWNGFRCPRCGKVFHRKFPWGNGFARECLHCGIAIGDVPSEIERGPSG